MQHPQGDLIMSKVSTLFFIAVAFAFSATPSVSIAGEPIAVADSVYINATIVKVNKNERAITLRDEHGNEEEVLVSEEVRNFDQIKEGDVLEVEYHRAAASTLQKITDASSAGKSLEVERAPSGAKPGMAAMQTSTIVATVLEIDTKARLLTVQGPKGGIVTVVVPTDIKSFDDLKKGDKISAEYGEAVAISVRTPAKK